MYVAALPAPDSSAVGEQRSTCDVVVTSMCGNTGYSPGQQALRGVLDTNCGVDDVHRLREGDDEEKGGKKMGMAIEGLEGVPRRDSAHAATGVDTMARAWHGAREGQSGGAYTVVGLSKEERKKGTK